MIERLFLFLQNIGYLHPVHPPLTHMVIGVVAAALLFVLAAILTRNPSLYDSARHCVILALIFLPLVSLAGYLDWQHYYAGAWMKPIEVKIGTAAFLLVALPPTWAMHRRRPRNAVVLTAFHLIALAAAAILGYVGGGLVY